jgi:ribonuclease BN (tRNA processing enzyme)
MDYARLVLQRWDQGAGRIPDLEVHGPAPLAWMTSLLFDRDGVYGADVRARIEHESSLDVYRERGGALPRRPPAPKVTEISAGATIKGRGWTLTAGQAAHVQPHLECLAFRIDSADGSICYSGDSGLCDTLVDLARGCDVLIQMNHYESGKEPSAAYRAACGNHADNAHLAQRAGVKTIVLTHILPDLDRPGVHDAITREIREVFSGQVIWGQDLMEIEVTG